MCDESELSVMSEFLWVLDADVMKALQQSAPDKNTYSDEFECKSSRVGNVRFQLRLCRKTGGSQFIGFGLKIISISRPSVSARFSVLASDVSWCKDAWTFPEMAEGADQGTWGFADSLLDGLDSLSFQFAVWFE